MRDDRYKKAPAPSCWRSFMKQLYRVADRQQPDRLGEKLAKALAVDVRRQLGRATLSELAGDAPALPGVGLAIGRHPTDLAANIDARIRALPADRCNDPAARRNAAELALREYAQRWGREHETHLAAEGAADRHTIMQSYRQAAHTACARALDILMSGTKVSTASEPFDIEQNLLPQKRRTR